MKRVLILLLGAFLLSAGAITITSQTGDPVQTIRRQYSAINKRAGKYRKVRKELSGFSLEGGQLVAYFDGPRLVKIIANHYGEGGRSVEEYYFSNDRLIFVYQRDLRYDRPMSGRVVSTKENRLYFNDDQLIRWIDEDGRPSSASGEGLQTRQKELLETARQFVAGARSKNRTIEAPN